MFYYDNEDDDNDDDNDDDIMETIQHFTEYWIHL